MDDLPPIPPAAAYHDVERVTLRGGALRAAAMVLAAAVLCVAWVVIAELTGIDRDADMIPWAVGLWLAVAVAGVCLVVRRFARRRLAAAAPWTNDRPWRRDGDVRRSLWSELPPTTILTVAVVAFVHLAVATTAPGTLYHYIVALLSIGIVVVILRAWLRGGVQVRWDAFPLRTGSRARFHIAVTAGGSSMSQFAARLRCIHPTYRPGDLGISLNVLEVPCATSGTLAAGPEEFVTIEFDIPADAPGTDLSRRGEERYWALAIVGTTAWGKIAETFVVPIYAVEGAPAGGAAPAEEE